MLIKHFLSISTVLCGALAVGGVQSEELNHNGKMALTQAPGAAQQLAEGSGDGVVSALANTAIDYYLPTLGEGLPAWAQRIEISLELQENLKPEWAITTVQPLYQSLDKEHTVFTQLSQLRYNSLGTDRDVTNIGVGYRKLFADNTVLAGVNTFFDYEWERKHKRGGLGAEVKWAGVDLTSNYYKGFGGKSGTGLTGDTKEEVLDGYDIELGAQVPYLPWAKIYAKKYVWNTVSAAEDIDGWSTSVEAKVQQNLTVEAGLADDNFMNSREHFAKVTFSLPFGVDRPAMLSNQMVSNTAWDARDMSDYTLDKVRRENKMIVERTSSGVVITRGN